jgi:PAS domain S-box-containing protein
MALPLGGPEGLRPLGAQDSALLETLLLEAPVGFAFYDTELRYRRINRVLAETNRLAIEAHIGYRPTQLLPEPLGGQVEEMLRRVLESGAVVADDDFSAQSPADGALRRWQSQWFPARSNDGEIIGVAVVVTDVTDRRQAEEALLRSGWRTARLQQATAELAGALTVAEVADVVARIGRTAIEADRSGVVLLDARTLSLVDAAQAGTTDSVDTGANAFNRLMGGEPLFSFPLPLARTALAAEAIRTRRPVYVGSSDAFVARFPDPDVVAWSQHTDERAWAVLPLIASGAPLGVLRFAFTSPRSLDAEDRVVLEALAGQCALAVERAQLLHRERATAQELQRSLLPGTLPQVEGVELAAVCRPGSMEARVGGDWYDAFRLPAGSLALVVGDVMGRGVAAAAGMGRVRTALRALALADSRPSAVLDGLDRLFTATEEAEQIVTLVYLVLDPATGEVVFGSAGHPPALLVPVAGAPRLLSDEEPASTPLGWPQPREERRVSLAPGDTILAYSDGLVESRARPIDEGIEQLVAVAASGPRSPVELLDRAVTELVGAGGANDDVTLVVLRRSR